MRKLTLLLGFLLAINITFAQSPKREVRAIWLTTYSGLDWPTPADPVATKKSKLITILDSHKALGINTIFFQVRGLADAFYTSTIVPWSNTLTGTYGTDPGWDPLQFAIDECHKRGMEIHAWLNPYRAASNVANIASYSSTHKAKTNPEWLLTDGVIRYFDPGLEDVRTHIIDVVKEIVTNYDVDGIHFDDYFYQIATNTPNDAATFASFPRGFAVLADWRRDNINLLISGVNTAIKNIKPWVKFGASPSGIYRSKTAGYPEGSDTGTGTTQHYSSHYADSKYWLEQGYVDYLVPQVYWYIGQTNSDFSKLIPWWAGNATNRHVYIGIAAYKVNDAAQGAFKTNTNEISDQINLIRTNTNLKGAVYFRSGFVTTNPLSFRTNLIANQYAKPALPPIMSWIDNTGPAAATNLVSSLNGASKTVLTWTAPAATAVELDKVSKYAIYRSTTATIDFEDYNNLIALTNTATDLTYTDISVTAGAGTSYYYAVRAVDRMGNESLSSNTVPDGVTLPVSLLSFEAKKNGEKVDLTWSTASETNNDKFVVERSNNQTGFSPYLTINATDVNSSALKNYTATDFKPLDGINYYRLVQYDKDGTRKELAIKAVQFDQLATFKGFVYPNPTTEQVNFSIENKGSGKIRTKLIDASGKQIHKENFDEANTNFTLSLKQKLAPGYYVLQVQQEQNVQQLKIIVQ